MWRARVRVCACVRPNVIWRARACVRICVTRSTQGQSLETARGRGMRAVKNAVPPWPLCHASPLYRTSGAGRLVRDEESSTGPASCAKDSVWPSATHAPAACDRARASLEGAAWPRCVCENAALLKRTFPRVLESRHLEPRHVLHGRPGSGARCACAMGMRARALARREGMPNKLSDGLRPGRQWLRHHWLMNRA